MTQTDLVAAQDSLRPLRMFVGAVSGALAGADQSNAWADSYAFNSPYRYQVYGPTGYGVEGAPIAATNNGGLYVSPMLILVGLGAAAVLFWKK